MRKLLLRLPLARQIALTLITLDVVLIASAYLYSLENFATLDDINWVSALIIFIMHFKLLYILGVGNKTPIFYGSFLCGFVPAWWGYQILWEVLNFGIGTDPIYDSLRIFQLLIAVFALPFVLAIHYKISPKNVGQTQNVA
jgi:hypothetical protein